MSEERVANDMTFRQVSQVVTIWLRDKTMLLSMIIGTLGGKARKANEKREAEEREKAEAEAEKAGRQPARKKAKLPAWFKPTRHGKNRLSVAAIADVDGPLDDLNTVVNGQFKVQRKGKPVRARRR